MRILILGGGGFIGKRITVAAVRAHGAGAVVAGVRRAGSGTAVGVEERLVDAEDEASVRAATAGVTHVINSVMGSHGAIVESAGHVAGLVADGRIEGAVHLSSIAVYGIRSGIVREDDPLGPPADGYAVAKIEAETLFASRARRRGVILRPGLVHGPGSVLWTRRIGRLLAAGRLGPMGPMGEGACALVHVDDVADAAISALTTSGAGGRSFTLVAQPAPTWNAYFTDLASAMDVPVRPLSPVRLGLERTLAYPLATLSPIMRRLHMAPPEAITPGLARLFGVDMRFGTSAVGTLLPGWRDYSASLRDSAAWLAKDAVRKKPVRGGS